MTASDLIEYVREHDGRPYRMMEPPLVFVLTSNEKLAEKLTEWGARSFRPPYMATQDYGPFGGFRRARNGVLNWDLYIHTIRVEGTETIWEAVGGPALSAAQARAASLEEV